MARVPGRWIVAKMTLHAVDLAANVATFFAAKDFAIMLIAAGVSAVCALLSMVTLALISMETTAFRAGYVSLLCRKFSRVFVLSILYLGLSVALVILILVKHSGSSFYWDDVFHAIFALQKLTAVAHLFFNKRALTLLSAEKLYNSSGSSRN